MLIYEEVLVLKRTIGIKADELSVRKETFNQLKIRLIYWFVYGWVCLAI